MNYEQLLQKSIMASVKAGVEILKIYNTNFNVDYKEDKSPVTQADRIANDTIIDELAIFNIPFLTEEGTHDDFEIRKTWERLWIIDPLDGTKEFIKRNGEFTVNIALAENGKPTLGVIYSPVSKTIYYAAKGIGAFKIDGKAFENHIPSITETNLSELLNISQKLPSATIRENYTIVASRSHMSSETYKYIENLKLQHGNVNIIAIGSSIKMCWVAEGVADEYPRFGPTMEWDTAAGQAILNQSNATLIDFKTNEPMLYNRKNLTNNWFIAKRHVFS
jgi:3'(2'), 5'-bisphosphate nucleotidase